MANHVQTFSYKDDKAPVIDVIKKIAEREGKDFSKIVVTALEDYAKVHGEGNNQHTLDTFQKYPDARAWPAFGADWKNTVMTADPKELAEIEKHAKTIDNWIRTRRIQGK